MVTSSGGGSGGGGVPRRVVRTGLALVHENEIVYPAAGGRALALQAVEDSRMTIHVYFPVEIEVRAGPEESGDGRKDVERALAEAARRIRGGAG